MFTHQAYFIKSFHRLPKRGSAIFRTYHYIHHLLDNTPHSVTVSINRSILDSLHQNHPQKALKIFRDNVRSGFLHNLNEVTLSLALKGCCGDPSLGSQIHTFALTSGFGTHVTVCNSLMNNYCKGGNFGKALCIFKNLSDPDVVSWNTLLSGFRRSEEALEFACRMNSSRVVFDAVTYTVVLSFCSSDEECLFGLQLHSRIKKSGLDCEVFVGNALISMYSRWGYLVEARRMFEELPYRDRVSWNAIISGYSQEEIYGFEAAFLFVEMVRRGIELDHVSVTGAVSACAYDRNLGLGRQMHSLVIEGGFGRHVSVGNVLISLYTKCEVSEDAKLVFQLMDNRNVISWTSIISISEENAVSLFNGMRLDGVLPNEITFVALVHAIKVASVVEQGRTVHGCCIKTGFSSYDPNVCNSLVMMYAKFGSILDSMKVFEELNYKDRVAWNALISGYVENGLFIEAIQAFFSSLLESKPDQYTFGSTLNAIGAAENLSLKHGQRCHCRIIKVGLDTNPIVSNALLGMYAKRGIIQEAQSVFHDMPQRAPYAWTAIISAYARHGEYELVMEWFNDMEREGVRPDSITFLSILAACGRKGMVDMGRHLFDRMIKDYQIEPLAEHYSSMVDMLGRAGQLQEAEELVSQIPGGPGLTVLQSLLAACRKHGNIEMGERVADALMAMEPTESGTYILMSNLYAEKGQWEKVAEVRKRMRAKGVKKEVGFSWVDVGWDGDTNAFCLSSHGFSSGDMCHPQWKMIHSMAEYLGLEMKFLRDRDRVEAIATCSP